MDAVMRFRLYGIASVVIVILLAVISSAQVKDRCQTVTLPPEAAAVLSTKYADWRPKNLSDLAGDDKALWLQEYPEDCPGIAIGHFEEPDRLAYALLLVPKSEPKHGYKIIVLRELASDHTYRATLLDQGESTTSGLVISNMPPGKYSDFEQTKSLRLKLDAVNVEWLEKAAVLYYWANGKYHTIQVSD